ncbi:response regulator [Lacrimispora sp. NSJ-141]|uniref:Circadian input-output histidine kinase CikA n=1 Tax=Lientehia hominis TaxID=2897778 RepID=A0AAP2RHS9_9FIRM|nr:response regulator [Lientehia hominis]MCD2491085.1 response regulator [Lientehia hominis]
MSENHHAAQKYHKLSSVTAIFLAVLMLGYYLVSVFYTGSIVEEIENIKEHPFPVVIAAGDMKVNSLQIRLLAARLGTDRSEEAIEEVSNSFVQNQESSREALYILTELYLTDADAAVNISTLYDNVIQQMNVLLEMCQNSGAMDAVIKRFTDNMIIPFLDEIDSELTLLVKNADNKFNEFYGQSLSYRKIMLLLVTALGIAVAVSLFIYQHILKKREKEAVYLQKQIAEAAQAANEAKSQFLSNMSHDIRTPMNAVIGMTAIASSHLDDRERVKKCLSKISTSSRHLLSLINEILDMSKIEKGKVVLNEEPISLADFVHDFVTIIEPQVKAKHLKLDLSILGITNEIVITDSMRLHQIMQNIMSNAIKFTDEGGEVRLRMEQKSCECDGRAIYEFQFSDTGIGMSEEFQQVLFQPFERAATSTVSKTEGTGLGMSITKNIVDIMGGMISVHSQINVGTTITVSLPLETEQQEEKIIPDLFKDLRSLVVDDDQDVCINTAEILEEIGMKSEWVLSGEEAVVRVETAHKQYIDYNVIILDWLMPGMDGVRTAREIRQKVGDDIPIIILSAYDWTDIEEEAREAGVTAFLSKPLFKSHLYEVMCDTLMPDRLNKDLESDTSNVSRISGRVLLVEDNALNLEIAETFLTERGLHVDTAENGREAITLVQNGSVRYDIIFMDVQMPVLDGYQATKAIRQLEAEEMRPRTIIVGMSANAFKEDVDKALSIGMDDYLTKPIDSKKLELVLTKYCSC